jgi:hypothetical protein
VEKKRDRTTLDHLKKVRKETNGEDSKGQTRTLDQNPERYRHQEHMVLAPEKERRLNSTTTYQHSRSTGQ